MRAHFFTLFVLLFAPLLAGAKTGVYADDFVFQKQLIIDNKNTCQAFFIHRNWLVTSAHCVESCLAGGCRVKVLLAQGEINASYALSGRDVFVPKQYRTADKLGRVTTHKVWDIALLHYQPQEFLYEFAEGGNATRSEFDQAMAKNPNLRAQWQGAVKPQIPVLHTYNGPELMTLKQNLWVPRWNWGELEMFSNPKTVLYFGEKASLWAADGFGVDHGNSGGAVVLSSGGVIGVATAKMDNNLPADVRQAFPTFGQADDFFLFTGFAPKTTLKFVEQTMMRFGDRPRTQRLQKVTPTLPQ